MLHLDNGDGMVLFVDLVTNAERAQVSRIDTSQLAPQLRTYPLRVLKQPAVDEVDNGPRHSLGTFFPNHTANRAGNH